MNRKFTDVTNFKLIGQKPAAKFRRNGRLNGWQHNGAAYLRPISYFCGMNYYLIAGERSGDLHGGNLIRAIRHHDPTATFRAWGGD